MTDIENVSPPYYYKTFLHFEQFFIVNIIVRETVHLHYVNTHVKNKICHLWNVLRDQLHKC
jgi:hypothetical protein